jgi:CTP:molybdopterin cytidylyltransferase MocA
MGRTKQLLAYGDRTILQAVIDNALASALNEVLVVLGHDGDRIRDALALRSTGRLRAVVHAHWSEGQSGSLRAGLSGLGDEVDAAAVLLGDQPDVDSALIDRVLDEVSGCGSPIHRPFHTSMNGSRVPGHPVVLSRSVWKEARALEGDEGARALIRAHPDWLCAVEVDGERPADVDTPEDYERLRNGAS